MFAEIELRARFEAIHAVSQENLVGVHGEDLLLRESPLDLNSEHYLLDLSAEILISRQKQVARELHRQSRSSLYTPAGTEIAVRSSQHSPDIDSPMALEIFIFDRDHCIA